MKREPFKFLVFMVTLALFSLPQGLQACSVCFGDPASPMTKGIASGIWLLLFVVFSVLGGIAAFFIFTVRRAAALNRQHEAQESFSETTNHPA